MHIHTCTRIQALYTKQANSHTVSVCVHTCMRTHNWTHAYPTTPRTHTLSLALLIFTSLRWLVEAFIKKQAVSQQFMANSIQLQGSVFLLQLWLMPRGIRQGQKERQGDSCKDMKKCQIFPSQGTYHFLNS